MTREEQIRKKAKELGQQYFPDSSNIWARSNVEACYVENACVEMAEWLDSHPHWIPVEEELPKAHFVDTSSKWVLVSIKGSVFIDSYNHKHKEWVNNGKCVDHWMPKPTPPAPRKED